MVILGCGSAKTGFEPRQVSSTSDCPKQANCTIELHANKSMVLKNDNFGWHYTLAEATGKSVVVYKYNKIVKGNLQDASYREEIVFEYDGKKDFTLTDNQLQDTKMLFGRFCYCKGQTGYYPIKQGQLSIDGSGHANLQFKIDEVPQIVKQIQFDLR